MPECSRNNAIRYVSLRYGRSGKRPLVSLAKLVLENNFFEFDEIVSRQKLGTAIGTKFAPGFENIFMGYSCELKPWVWWRFLMMFS